MKALTIDKNSHTEFVDIPEAVCGDNDVLIDVQRVGLCGSDLNTYRGFNPLVTLASQAMKLAAKLSAQGAMSRRPNRAIVWWSCLAQNAGFAAVALLAGRTLVSTIKRSASSVRVVWRKGWLSQRIKFLFAMP